MNRKIEILQNILAENLNYLLIFMTAHVILTDFVVQKPILKHWIVLGLLPVCYYLLREKCKNLPSFFLFHFLLLLPVLFWPEIDTAERVLLFAASLFFLVASIQKRLTADNWGMNAAMPVSAVGLSVALYILDGIQAQGREEAFLFQTTVFFLTGYFLYYFLHQFLHYVNINNRTTEVIPVDHVFFSALTLALGFIVLLFLVLIFCSNRELAEEIGIGIRKGIVGLITLLFSLFPQGSGREKILPSHREESVGADFLMQKAEPSWFMKLMDVILSLGAVVILALILGMTVMGLFRFIREGFRRRRRTQGEQDTKQKDLVERLTIKETGQKKKRKSLSRRLGEILSPQERIRRLYKKTLLRGLSGAKREEYLWELNHDTARESCRKLFPGAEKEAAELAGIYEKARYFGKGCGGEDVKRARELSAILAQERARCI